MNITPGDAGDGWRRFVDNLDRDVRTAGEFLSRRIGIQADVSIRDWTDHFSRLTLDYADLQTETEEIPSTDRQEANVTQLCFLVATFIDDRARDRQITLTRQESRFARAVNRRGMNGFRMLSANAPHIPTWILSLYGAYQHSLTEAYVLTGSTPLRYARVRRIACARGYPGLLVALALAARAKVDDARLRRMKTAFDCLMLGLQWLDDLSDWREDIASGDINLLIDVLRVYGLDARSHPDNDMREINVGYALARHGVLHTAAAHSTRWLSIAAARQRDLRCYSLADMIEDRKFLVCKRLKSELSRIETETLAHMAYAELQNAVVNARRASERSL